MRELKEGGAVFCLFISSSWASCSYLQFLFHVFKHSFFILYCYFILFSTDLLSPGGLSSYRRTQRYCYVYSLRRNHSPVQFSSVQFSRSVVSDSLRLQHARPPYPSSTPGVYSNSCPLSWWCHPTISSSVVPFSSCLQSFPAPGSFPALIDAL